jgi:hypothetical protein
LGNACIRDFAVTVIRNRFALTVHPRSIERALERGEKKTS